jgi:glycosyltransferase involved in cell wall biosynthesis
MSLDSRRTVAVVPAYNEEATVVAVLEGLYPRVDELVVVDDGSTDGTRAAIQAWLPGHDRTSLIGFDRNRGMSAAYSTALDEVRRRFRAGELDADDLVLTIDADGQHDLAALDQLCRLTVDENLDALLLRRDLSTYPAIKRFGNWVVSAWASVWAGARLYDVESGYRAFRVAAIADALDYYRGWRYSETVEVAVVLCRLGYRVRNDVLVPVPVFRSRTRYSDALIDLTVIPLTAWRVRRRRGRLGNAPRMAPSPEADRAAPPAALSPAGRPGSEEGR